MSSNPLTPAGAEINRIKRNYLESQSRRSSKLRGLNSELQGVQKIMFENIDAALQRGELVSGTIRYIVAVFLYCVCYYYHEDAVYF